MEDASLVDTLKRNVNYQTQLSAISWRTPIGNRKPSTFKKYVQAFKETNNNIRQLKHRIPKQAISTARSSILATKPKATTTNRTNLLGQKTTPTVSIIPIAVNPLLAGEPIDLSSAIATIKGYKLNEPGVRDIYNKQKLYYYYKL